MTSTPRLLLLSVLALLLSGCNSALPTPVPTEPPLEPVEIYLDEAQATLTIVRTMTAAGGPITITAAVPLAFWIDESDPKQVVMVTGTGTGTAALNLQVSGTGGSYTITAEWPVEYEVKGSLFPNPDMCKMALDVEETLYLSREVVAHTSIGMDVPIVGGEDEFTAFPKIEFDEIESPETRTVGTDLNVFTLDDICMPKALGCDYAWPVCPG
ncbi:MAG: hypothetical protein MUO35_13900 [Anaerolineales bacterium]|nr:hypothetical protein [Anaerolineales bacterium]